MNCLINKRNCPLQDGDAPCSKCGLSRKDRFVDSEAKERAQDQARQRYEDFDRAVAAEKFKPELKLEPVDSVSGVSPVGTSTGILVSKVLFAFLVVGVLGWAWGNWNSKITEPTAAVAMPTTDQTPAPTSDSSGNVEYMKYISDAGRDGSGSQFFSVKCKGMRPFDVLYEPKNSHQWFTVPASDTPLPFYSGSSPEAFATAACKTNSPKPSSVASIKGGIGSTASGIKSYTITCSNGINYELENDPSDGLWFTLDGTSFDRYKGLGVQEFAGRFCRDK